MVAVGNTSLINLMMASRLLYGMANERAIPRVFGAVHERRRTPWVAIICTTVIALVLASWSGVRTLGGTTALLLLCVFALVNVAVLVLRQQPGGARALSCADVVPRARFGLVHVSGVAVRGPRVGAVRRRGRAAAARHRAVRGSMHFSSRGAIDRVSSAA